jgi:hypothetical protein
MKSSQIIRLAHRADRSVARWIALLLIALATVLAALFLSARLLLSLVDEQGLAASGRFYHPLIANVLLSRDDAPNGSAASRRDWWRSRELC